MNFVDMKRYSYVILTVKSSLCIHVDVQSCTLVPGRQFKFQRFPFMQTAIAKVVQEKL